MRALDVRCTLTGPEAQLSGPVLVRKHDTGSARRDAPASGVLPDERSTSAEYHWRSVSAEAMGWALRHSPYKGAEFACHLMVADVVNDTHDNEFWMSTSNLAAKARCSRRSAIRFLANALRDGLLEVVEAGGKQGKPTRYRFMQVSQGGAGGVSHDGSGGEPNPTGGVSHHGSQDSIEITSREQTREIDESFEGFWREYPKKVDKARARTKYRARVRAGATPEQLLTAVTNYAEAMRGSEARFVKHGATFLNEADGPWSEYLVRRPTQRRAARGEVVPHWPTEE